MLSSSQYTIANLNVNCKGFSGAIGLQGDVGSIGNTGLQGPIGDSGQVGLQGQTGAQGTKGISGTGVAGVQGSRASATLFLTGTTTISSDTPDVNTLVCTISEPYEYYRLIGYDQDNPSNTLTTDFSYFCNSPYFILSSGSLTISIVVDTQLSIFISTSGFAAVDFNWKIYRFPVFNFLVNEPSVPPFYMFYSNFNKNSEYDGLTPGFIYHNNGEDSIMYINIADATGTDRSTVLTNSLTNLKLFYINTKVLDSQIISVATTNTFANTKAITFSSSPWNAIETAGIPTFFNSNSVNILLVFS